MRVAVVGATDLVGEEIVSLLAERDFPLRELLLFGPAEVEGEEVAFRDGVIRVQSFPEAVPVVDVMFLCAGPEIAAKLGPPAASAGTLSIDLAAHAATDDEVPTVLGIDDLPPMARHANGGLLVRMADPLTRLAAVPLRAFGALARLERVVGTFLIPASAFGRDRVRQLSEQTIDLLNLREPSGAEPAAEIAFRCSPERPSSGQSVSNRVARELCKLVGTQRVVANVVEVPAFFGQAASVAIELGSVVSTEEGRKALREAPSLLVMDGEERVSTLDVVGSDAIFIVGLRHGAGDERWLHFWALGDNVRQGAALPAVALAESVIGGRCRATDRDSTG
jgi:aspartate-semialdehyde dehydrogenase